MKRLITFVGGLALFALAGGSLQAQVTYTWSGGAGTADWTNGANWTSTTNTAPSTLLDTAIIATSATNQIVTYSLGGTSSGNVGTLSLSENTAGVTNLLDVESNLTVSNNFTLGGGTGVALLDIDAQRTNGTSAFPVLSIGAGGTAGTLTVTNGGVLDIHGYTSASVGSAARLNANLVVNGGLINVETGSHPSTEAAISVQDTLGGAFTMTSGTLAYGTPVLVTNGLSGSATVSDNRLNVAGNVNITGGVISVSSGTGMLWMSGAVNTLTGVIVPTFNFTITLNSASAQSLTSDQILPTLNLRDGGNNTITVTDSNTSATGNVGTLALSQGNAATTNTFKLGSNLKSTITSGQAILPNGVGGTASAVTYAIDTAGFILDLSGTSGGFTPQNATAGSSGFGAASWILESSTGTGIIKAQFFNFAAASSSSSTNVSSLGNIIFQATGTNGTTSDLGYGASATTGSLASSTFLYSGGAAYNNAAKLQSTSNRAIGALTVTNGFLKLNQSNITTAAAVTVNGGGGLDLNGVGAAGTLALGTGQNFVLNTGTLVFDLGTSINDQVIGNGGTGSGGTFSLSGLTLYLSTNSGFSFANSYQLFTNFNSSTALGSISLFNDTTGTASSITGFVGNIDSTGLLTFSAVPEPEPLALVAGAAVLGAFLAVRRRRLAQG